jgi:drug/metabolite transporter (DMT)-like permease
MTERTEQQATAMRQLAPAHSEPAGRARQAALAGVAVMLLAMFLFAANDVMGKWLVATYSVGQILLLRSLAALVVLAPFIWRQGVAAMLRVREPGMMTLRAVFSTLEVVCFYWAVMFLPLADVMTYYLAAPIWVAALSPVLLGERVGWRRWTAILIGFIGVVIALNPSAASLTLPALVALLGSLFFALMVITARKLSATGDTVLVTWQTAGALVAGILAAPFAWVPPSPPDFALLALLGVVAMLGHVCVIRAMKLAPAATVAPYQYTILVWAIVLGYPVFGDLPTPHMLAGAGVIIAAGLFIFQREQRLKVHAAQSALTQDPPA